jgi:hypothetical protein
LTTPTLQLSAARVQAHFKELYQVFSAGRKDYARRMLYATLDGCSSCHTQVKQDPHLRWDFKEDEIKGTSFEKAEFLFAVRHYDDALKNYDKIIQGFKAGKGDTFQLEQALRKKLVVYLRTRQDPVKAASVFEEDLKKNKTKWPKFVRDEMQGWIDALKKIPLKDIPPLSALAPDNLESTAQLLLSPLIKSSAKSKPGTVVPYLYVSGLIYYYLNNPSQPEATPALLYWLGVCDRHLSQSYFFSLSEIYFKECIRRFATSPVARKCYLELESTVMESFTGSSGVNLPEETQKELEELKDLLEAKKVEPSHSN